MDGALDGGTGRSDGGGRSEPARLPPAEAGVEDVDPAIADRLGRGDATALVDVLELRGGTVKSISVGEPR